MQTASKREGKKNSKKKDEIQSWLVEQIAGLLYLDQKQIDPRATFNSYGLSSRDAVMLSGDLEEWLERRLSPTLVYEYPTINSLAEYLAQPEAPVRAYSADSDHTVSNATDAKSSPRQFTSDLSALDLEKMTEEDAETLLLEKLDRLSNATGSK